MSSSPWMVRSHPSRTAYGEGTTRSAAASAPPAPAGGAARVKATNTGARRIIVRTAAGWRSEGDGAAQPDDRDPSGHVDGAAGRPGRAGEAAGPADDRVRQDGRERVAVRMTVELLRVAGGAEARRGLVHDDRAPVGEGQRAHV